METKPVNTSSNEEMALDDARRTKVLSPTMLVMQRFFRNRLAIIGLVILVIMFVFSFLGGLFTPYSQAQVFKGLEYIKKDYATAVYNTDLRMTMKEGVSFSASARSQMNFAIGKNSSFFTAGDQVYGLDRKGDDFYTIHNQKEIFTALVNPKGYKYKASDGTVLSDELKAAFETAHKAGETGFAYDGTDYQIEAAKKNVTVYASEEIGLASRMIYDAADPKDRAIVDSFGFRNASQTSFAEGDASFEWDGAEYGLEIDGENAVITKDGKHFAFMSDISVEPKNAGVSLNAEFKAAARNAIQDRLSEFSLQEGAEEPTRYLINRVNTNYYIQRFEASEVIRTKEAPSREHPLGLDTNGMDVLTRLMYGGRVSLLVGFVVVFFEILIGVIVGGISGYFGGWIDDVLMRLVDLVNAIPFWPVVIIAGSMMDVLQMSSTVRIFFLMFILGILGWTGIARVVRGQILSLKEQDFMMATEAAGIPVSRRIFRHLLPNVMPLLIVQATISLGSTIISEATLSFLGLGVKYPLASWGSIINAANDIFIMTNYWYIWIPAGILILVTVLGFNFVGDGLRDAFDPKMKS